MCTVWEGQNSFPEAWSTLKNREESQYSNDGSSHFLVSQPFSTRGFFFSHSNDTEQLAPLRLPVELRTNWPKLSPPGAANVGLQIVRPQGQICGWRCAVTVLRLQRGQQPGRALSVIAWPPVCSGRQIPFHEAWHGKQRVRPHIQKHLSSWRRRGEKRRPQGWMWKGDLFGEKASG